jgi:hypothetical protein
LSACDLSLNNVKNLLLFLKKKEKKNFQVLFVKREGSLGGHHGIQISLPTMLSFPGAKGV